MTIPTTDIVDLAEVARRLSVPPKVLLRMIADREIPEPTRYESGATGWPESVIDDWIANRPRVTDPKLLRKLLKD